MSAPVPSVDRDGEPAIGQVVRTVHVIGASPLCLLIAALPQDVDGPEKLPTQ